MNCIQCGAALPPNAKFCFQCGAAAYAPGQAPAGAPPPPPPSAVPPLAPVGAEALKCPNCGAPVHPVPGDMVVSCEYCGSSVTLAGTGWKAISKHTMLAAKITTPDQALQTVHAYLDTGFLHRKDFEESTITEQRLSFVPFWVVPVTATTNYVYQDLVVGVGGTVGTIAAAEILGSALGGGRRGGFFPIPVMTGPPVNPTRAATISGSFDFPVVAVKGMSAYQPKSTEFDLPDRVIFDKKAIPAGAPILNGDLGEDAAQHAAQSYVTQLHAEQAHKQHHMVSGIRTETQVSEAELLHVPIFYFRLDHRGQPHIILVDAHSGRVIQTVGP
jgi:hypothetical protein